MSAVPEDLRRLAALTFRRRKLLWIVSVPFAAVGVCALEGNIIAGVAVLCVAAGLAVVALTKRSPERQDGIRLLMERPNDIDRIFIQEHGTPQIAFAQGVRYLGFIEIEDVKKFNEALSIVTAHLPNVAVDYSNDTTVEFIDAHPKFWRRW